ncbi:molybdopterin oxidoreductase, membrane subunit [hydrocarbon metagenome]|uniref:Molybdopterin oxidoreductase, membrane subunit n=1 Tax=hydrocarbon metagenome TaxID=938273 RepID=A0A0W8G4L2_9ZZZZ
MRYKFYTPLALLAVAGIVLGAFGLSERLIHGLNPTALGSYIPWGLWVAFYLFFLGLSAGAFLVNIMVYVFGMRQFEGMGRLSAFVVLVALFCELQFILLDLGQMHRAFYQFFLTPSFSSLMTWMFVLFNAMLLLYLLKTFFLIRGDLVAGANDPARGGLRGLYRLLSLGKASYDQEDVARDAARVHRLAVVSLPVGLLFYGANGAFFAILLSRPIWNSALTPLLFIVAALLSGGALVVFLAHLFRIGDTRQAPGVCLTDALCIDLGRVVMYLLVVFLGLEAMQFFVGYQSGREMVVASLDHIVKGPQAWVFWVVHLVAGSLVPLVMLLFFGKNARAVAWACFLIVATFAAVRINFILPDLAVYKLEGLSEAFHSPRLTTDYVPNLNEWLVSIFVMSSGLLLFLLGARYLPIITGKGDSAHG